ncbi:hypothetical protein RZN25_09895 [Bacillaceae bacterium S4-13-56]
MKDIIEEGFGQKVKDVISIGGNQLYRTEEGLYAPRVTYMEEQEWYERREVSEFFQKRGLFAVGQPALYGEKPFLEHDGMKYMFSYFSYDALQNQVSPGEFVARFHVIGQEYPYMPNFFSNYGRWKALWEQKLAVFEQWIARRQQLSITSTFDSLLMDTYPYWISLAENSIQYIGETEKDPRFDQSDQGTFTFQRFHLLKNKGMVFPDEIVFDHPTRDLAEFVRGVWLDDKRKGEDIRHFLNHYFVKRDLSVFSWRMLYSRLLFPAHFMDVIVDAMNDDPDVEWLGRNYAQLLKKQNHYEKELLRFFSFVNIPYENWKIPILDW